MTVSRRAALWTGALAVSGLGGCTLTKPKVGNDGPLTTIGSSGRLVQAPRCRLEVIILTRPLNDPTLSQAIWEVADEQIAPPELRRAWWVNGLRFGRITGDLPPEVAALLRARPPDKPDVQVIDNPSGEPIRIDANHAEPRPSVNLLLSDQEGNIKGKPYQHAKGYLRVTASQQGKPEVELKLTPELHHGPFEQGIGMVPNSGVLMPREFQYTTSQKEESFRELTAELLLGPGQVVVLGAWPDRPSSLGELLYHKFEPKSDRMLQCVALIWATGSQPGVSPSTVNSRIPQGMIPVWPDQLDLR
jgi:hypothetical protein